MAVIKSLYSYTSFLFEKRYSQSSSLNSLITLAALIYFGASKSTSGLSAIGKTLVKVVLVSSDKISGHEIHTV